ncbi:gb [Venturia nashicola]|uniref:Gb n=1 Tax=Venturia nashicola TaxID=86259 RepID=A0A4Z1NSN6_9PEZI|nr:gb [Venturia nashicola]TLD26227.1 gb [Venturia nashicola]
MTPPVSPPVNPTTDPKAAAPTTTIPNSTIDPSIKAINTFAVELDSTPVSPVLQKPDSASTNRKSKSLGPAEEDEEAYEEMMGEKGMAEEVRERRKQLLASRAKDPAVLVDIPPTPRAEEYEVAEEAKMAGTTGAVAQARLKRDEKEIEDKGVGS